MSKTPNPIRMPAPCYGEHTDYLLSELLGVTKGQLAELAAEKVTVSVPLQYAGEL